jgi:hypothetical protein
MKTLLLLFIIGFTANFAQSQVVCAGISPASIAGNYSFSWGDPANTWGSPDFNIPGTTITGELMLVDDGSLGNSPASGLPLAYYGCSPLLNNLTGKIAVVYRYDGVTASTICWMSEKALIAQNAGAIGVLFINRPGANTDLSTGGATSAPNVIIPAVLIDFNDGALLLAELLQGNTVTMFFGNKTGLYANDIGVVNTDKLISKSMGVSSQLSTNNSEFNFELGTRIFNYGSSNQTNVMVTANVDGPSGTSVFNSVVGPIPLLAGDTIDVYPGEIFSFPQFSLTTYPAGRYKLTYSVSLGVPDEYPGDNMNGSDFVINDSIISYSALDPLTNLPTSQNFSRPATNNNTYSNCMVIKDPNSSRIGVEGIYFSASTVYGSGVSLSGEEMALFLYQWDDVFTDLNDVNLTFNMLNPISLGYYYYPSDLQGETVYGAFSTPVVLEDNRRYLACIKTINTSLFLGSDAKTNYLWNESYYLQPSFPIESDGVYAPSGFGADSPPAMGLKIFDAIEAGITNQNQLNFSVFPNPSQNSVSVSINAEGNAKLSITDVSGKEVMITTLNLINSESEINISTLQPGMYIFNIVTETGESSQFNVIKN